MFNPNSWQSHAEYHNNFKHLKIWFPSQIRMLLWVRYSKEREKLMSLNLDPTGEYLSLRSFILFAMLFNRTDA